MLDFIKSHGFPVTAFLAEGAEGAVFRMGDAVFKAWSLNDVNSHDLWKAIDKVGGRPGMARVLDCGYLRDDTPYTVMETVAPLDPKFLEGLYRQIHQNPEESTYPPLSAETLTLLKANMGCIASHGYRYEDLAQQLGVARRRLGVSPWEFGEIVIFDCV